MTLVSHTFNGTAVKVKKGTRKEMDSYARAILTALAGRQNPNASEHWEVDRMPAEVIASSVPRKRGRPRKVIAPITGEMPAESVTAVAESTLYAQGFYRVACATCGKGIPLTGKRGRAPKYHADCRPTDSE